MISRIPQRTQDDCTICVVTMVIAALLGSAYTYDRVLADSRKYCKTGDSGMFSAWWETYFQDEGLHCCYCRLNGLCSFSRYSGEVVGLLLMEVLNLKPGQRVGHVVAIDEYGVVDPADNAPDHIALDAYIEGRTHHGFAFESEWLAVSRRRFDMT